MGRAIILTLGGEVSSFDFGKIDRDRLYGRKERLVVDENEQPCVAAYLTSDGRALVPPGGTSFLHVDPDFDCVEREEQQAVDADGRPLPLCPSTVGVEQPLRGPVAPERVLEHSTNVVYQLQPQSLGTTLAAALAAGQIFETRFNYRDDYADAPAFLLENTSGVFLLVGAPVSFDFVRRDEQLAAAASGTDDDDDASDELDFGMM